MVRWEPGAAERLQSAALELFVERGFANVTVPEITQRAGLTTRTFFRHFADKREVLFVGEDELPELVAATFASAATNVAPMDLILTGLHDTLAPRFDGTRDYLRLRRSIIASDDGLRERELRKMADLEDAVARGFRERGMPDLKAGLTGRIAVGIFNAALTSWIEGNAQSLGDAITASAAAASALLTKTP